MSRRCTFEEDRITIEVVENFTNMLCSNRSKSPIHRDKPPLPVATMRQWH